jgi:molecular chaperone GrpE (heat shock protein)
MLSIYESESFQNDYHNYKNKIDKITDQAIKNQLENFLAKLVAHVKAFDKEHAEMIYSKSIRLGNDHKDGIAEVRKNIDRKLRDWELTQNPKSNQSS